MSKIAIVGDAHFGVRNDNKIFHDIFISFYDSLREDLKAREIKDIILLGDIFERRKFINFETLSIFKRQVMDKFKEDGFNIYLIAGNHDVYYKNTNRINSIDLCIPEKEYPNVKSVIHTAETVNIAGVDFLFVPWVNKENYDGICKSIVDSESRYMVAHLDMAGFEMHKGAISDHGHFDADFLGKFDSVITGHYHTKSSKGNIHYLGTPYATSWNDYGEDKGYHIFENGEFTFVKNDQETFYRFSYDDRDSESIDDLMTRAAEIDFCNKYVKVYIRSKKDPGKFETFLSLIESKVPADLSIIDETNFVTEATEDEEECGFSDTLSIIQRYITSDLTTDLDKGKLFQNIAVLYQSALEISDDD